MLALSRRFNNDMNLQELEILLANYDGPKDKYCLAGGLPNEACCIEERTDRKWQTYYSERGEKNSLKVFDSEDEACNFFFDWVTS